MEPSKNSRSNEFYVRMLVVSSAIFLLVSIGLLVNQFYKAQLTLYVVNGLNSDALVEIPDLGYFFAPARINYRRLTIPEGKYKAMVKVGNRLAEPVEMDLRQNFFERFFGNHVFVLNIAGGSVIVWERSFYQKNYGSNLEIPFRLIPGERFMRIENIDYAFQEFPDVLAAVKQKNFEKTRIDALRKPPERIVDFLLFEKTSSEIILDYMENHLRADSNNEALLWKYKNYCLKKSLSDRAISFLEGLLTFKPVPIACHCTYHELISLVDDKTLLKKHQKILEDLPDHSVAFYIRGKLAPNCEQALKCFKRAVESAPKSPLPWLALAQIQYKRGNFTEAKNSIECAYEMEPDNKMVKGLLFRMKFALGEHDELRGILEEATKKNPMDFLSLDCLMQIYFSQNEGEKAREALDSYLASMTFFMKKDYFETGKLAQLKHAYFKQDFQEYLKIAQSMKNPQTMRNALLNSKLNLLDMNGAEAIIQKTDRENVNGFTCLLMAIGWKLKGDLNKTIYWISQASDNFAKSPNPMEQVISSFLSRKDELVLKKLDDLNMPAFQQATICVMLASIYPKQKSHLLKLARKMNFDLNFPHFFLKKAIETE